MWLMVNIYGFSEAEVVRGKTSIAMTANVILYSNFAPIAKKKLSKRECHYVRNTLKC